VQDEGAQVFAPPGAPLIGPMLAATVDVTELDPDDPAAVEVILDAICEGEVVWVVGPGGDQTLLRPLLERLAEERPGVEVELLTGSWDSPGGRLLDLVAVMDQLRSPGGCPWDAEQTHASLAPYLIEEAYEALEAIETGDDAALREELGDVLLQVVFHSRLAQERPDGWTIDDLAGELIEKLIRRHPHVFGDLQFASADEVDANWETIKTAERGGRSALANVPMGQPALRLAGALQRKADRIAGPTGAALPRIVAPETIASEDDAARALWALVARCRELDVDPEAALRALARAFRDEVAAAERDVPPTAGQRGPESERR